jgi:hypothetical protein
MTKRLAGLVLAACSFSTCASSQEARPRVVLDAVTFAGPGYQVLQDSAEQVARVVEELIPGDAPTSVFCFTVAPEWGHAPITLVGRPQPGEPAAAALYPVRVALTRNVLPADRERFSFQLAHELAHVRMDARFDSDIIETFAVAVSFEVLERLGYKRYLRAAVESLIAPLPVEIREAVTNGSWNDVNSYLRKQRPYHQEHPFDYSLAAAGAMLIRSANLLPWNRLLGVAAKNECPARQEAPRFQFCPLNESALPEFLPVFRLLGRAAAPGELALQGLRAGGN